MNPFDTNPFVTLTYKDLQRIIMLSNSSGHQGKYIYSLGIVQPRAASQGSDSTFVIDENCLYSASESEPYPKVVIC